MISDSSTVIYNILQLMYDNEIMLDTIRCNYTTAAHGFFRCSVETLLSLTSSD